MKKCEHFCYLMGIFLFSGLCSTLCCCCCQSGGCKTHSDLWLRWNHQFSLSLCYSVQNVCPPLQSFANQWAKCMLDTQLCRRKHFLHTVQIDLFIYFLYHSGFKHGPFLKILCLKLNVRKNMFLTKSGN